MKQSVSLAAASLILAGVGAAVLPIAPAAAAVNAAEPGPFIDTLADEAFATLRSGNRAAARPRFRALLAQHFDVDAIGDRLIQRWRGKITPAQYQAYKTAFPAFIINTYADRLFDYSRADLRIVRAVPRGDGAVVQTQVVNPGAAPIAATWTVERGPTGYRVTNLTVAGINLAITQAADFDAIIQRRGFDALVALMRSRA